LRRHGGGNLVGFVDLAGSRPVDVARSRDERVTMERQGRKETRMDTQTRTSTLLARDARGEERQLVVFEEPRSDDRGNGKREWLRWARDEDGRWYSFNASENAVLESLSGIWFDIVDYARAAVSIDRPQRRRASAPLSLRAA
jgi:hypothetical protein